MSQDCSMFLKRPTAEETDDDLMKMQEEWQEKKVSSVEIHKMTKRKRNEVKNDQNRISIAKSTRDQAARFTIDLDDIREETDAQNVLFGVQERNHTWLTDNKMDEILRSGFSSNYSKDDGFPETLDLSSYYEKSANPKRVAPGGMSFFAAEFDRIHGNLEENLDASVSAKEEQEMEDFEKENDQYLASLDVQKIEEMRKEIEDRLDPKLIEFLANRRKTMEDRKGKEEKPKISKFKSRRMAEKSERAVSTQSVKMEEIASSSQAANSNIAIDEMLNELEVLDEFGNREDREKYDRLATDAIHLDLAAKFGRNVAGRQQKNAVRLFESCAFRPTGYDGNDGLREAGRSAIEQIKELYLEEVELDGYRGFEFAKGVNPILDGCWTLVPARRVLDAVEKRQGKVLGDDVEIVRLALLWTLLLFEERKSAFFAFAQPNDVYVYLSEIFLIGPEMLEDERCVECIRRLMDSYVVKAAAEGRIVLRMTGKIAGLDAFSPFFENLLRNFEEYSLGNAQFTRAILIGAYLNAPIGDSMEFRMAIWSPKRSVVRQMIIGEKEGEDILGIFKRQAEERNDVVDEQHYVQYMALLGVYVAAIRDDVVTRDRNPLMFSIASFEIGNFVKRQKNMKGNEEKRKQLEILLEIIRKSIGEKLVVG